MAAPANTPGKAPGSTRNASIDSLRLLAAIVVVIGHANVLCDTRSLVCLSTIHGSFRLAVPVFLLISGYFFFEAYKARRHWPWVRRIFRLYAVWMLIYSPFWLILPIQRGVTGDIPENLVFGYYHLWYLAAVAGGAVLTILLARLGLLWLTLVALTALAAGLVLQYALNYGFLPDRIVHHGVMGWLHRNFLFFGFPFFALGYVMAAAKIETKTSRNLGLGLFIAGLGLLALEVGGNLAYAGKVHVFEIYAAVLVGAPALLIIALKTNWQTRNRHMAKFSEAVFLLHVLVLNILVQLVDVAPFTLGLLCLAIASVLAIGLIWLDRRVKGVFL